MQVSSIISVMWIWTYYSKVNQVPSQRAATILNGCNISHGKLSLIARIFAFIYLMKIRVLLLADAVDELNNAQLSGKM